MAKVTGGTTATKTLVSYLGNKPIFTWEERNVWWHNFRRRPDESVLTSLDIDESTRVGGKLRPLWSI